MVNSDSTIPTETKVKAYWSLAETNKAWGTIITSATELEEAGILTSNQSERFRLVAQEFQADMNYCITNRLSTQETKEAGHYEKLRIAFEKALNPPEEPNPGQQPPEPGSNES